MDEPPHFYERLRGEHEYHESPFHEREVYASRTHSLYPSEGHYSVHDTEHHEYHRLVPVAIAHDYDLHFAHDPHGIFNSSEGGDSKDKAAEKLSKKEKKRRKKEMKEAAKREKKEHKH